MLQKFKRIMRITLWCIGFPIRVVMRLGKMSLTLILVGALALNIATLVSTTVFNVLSGAVESVIGPRTVRAMSPEKRRVTYRGKKVLMKDAVKDTGQRIGTRVEKMTARNIASMAGESLPYVGATVVVAATAWEVRDACSLLNEMNELSVAFDPDAEVDSTKVCGQRVPTKAEVIASIKASPGMVWSSTKETYRELTDVSLPGLYDGLWDGAANVWCRYLDCDTVETVPE